MSQRRPQLGELDAAAKAAREPLPPEDLIDAKLERVHREPGRARAAHVVRVSGSAVRRDPESPDSEGAS